MVPILTTTLRAVRTASRCTEALMRRSPGVPSVLPCAHRRHPLGLLEADVGASPPTGGCRYPPGGLRLPVEGHIADRHRTARRGALLEQFVLDAQTGQAVAR